MALTFSSDDGAGTGLSAGLGRGLIASYKGVNITGEGMGVGSVAVITGGFTYFAETTGIRKSRGKTVKKFLINKRLVRTFFGRPSMLFTGLAAKHTQLYMSGAALQKTLLNVRLLALIKKILGFGAIFETVKPVAEAECVFAPREKKVHVSCAVKIHGHAPASVYLMNEFSADYFDSAFMNGGRTSLPAGWEKIQAAGGLPRLRWEKGRVDFSVSMPKVRPDIPVSLFWGREKADGISWAGFEFEALLSGHRDMAMSYELVLEGKGLK